LWWPNQLPSGEHVLDIGGVRLTVDANDPGGWLYNDSRSFPDVVNPPYAEKDLI